MSLQNEIDNVLSPATTQLSISGGAGNGEDNDDDFLADLLEISGQQQPPNDVEQNNEGQQEPPINDEQNETSAVDQPPLNPPVNQPPFHSINYLADARNNANIAAESIDFSMDDNGRSRSTYEENAAKRRYINSAMSEYLAQIQQQVEAPQAHQQQVVAPVEPIPVEPILRRNPRRGQENGALVVNPNPPLPNPPAVNQPPAVNNAMQQLDEMFAAEHIVYPNAIDNVWPTFDHSTGEVRPTENMTDGSIKSVIVKTLANINNRPELHILTLHGSCGVNDPDQTGVSFGSNNCGLLIHDKERCIRYHNAQLPNATDLNWSALRQLLYVFGLDSQRYSAGNGYFFLQRWQDENNTEAVVESAYETVWGGGGGRAAGEFFSTTTNPKLLFVCKPMGCRQSNNKRREISIMRKYVSMNELPEEEWHSPYLHMDDAQWENSPVWPL